MKLKKLLILSSIILFSLITGSSYAWLVDKKDLGAISVDAGTIMICPLPLFEGGNNYAPGESIIISAVVGDFAIKNMGNRDAIVKLSSEYNGINGISGNLKNRPDPAFISDYEEVNGVWQFGSRRLKEVTKFRMTYSNSFISRNYEKWIEIDGNYYIKIPKGMKRYMSEVRLDLLPELGGSSMGANGKITPSRPFEQESSFKFQIYAVAVQANAEAVKDIFGTNVFANLPRNWYD